MNSIPPISSKGILFWPLLKQAAQYYYSNIASLLLLAALSYLPFLLIGWFSSIDLSDPMELLHGFLLDILVCLALPTILTQGRVLPLATLKIFQDFFAQAIVTVIGQLFLLFFLMVFFSSFGLPFFFLAFLPFVFVLFIGQFGLVSGKSRIRDLADNMLSSAKLVKERIRVVCFSYINISMLMILPIFLYSMLYISNHSSTTRVIEQARQDQVDQKELQTMITQLKTIVDETGYKEGRLVVHLLFRPLKSLFLALLFAQLLQIFAPMQYNRFFLMIDSNHQPDHLSSQEFESKD